MESFICKQRRVVALFYRIKVLFLLSCISVVVVIASFYYADPIFGNRRSAYSHVQINGKFTSTNSSSSTDNELIQSITIRNLMPSRMSTPTILSQSQYEKDKEMFSNYSTIYKLSTVNCANIFENDTDAMEHGRTIARQRGRKVMLKSEYYIDLAKNCDNFKRTRGYITSYLTKQEKEFPLAYSIISYRDPEMVERILRSIYRPQNFYCIHVDVKAKPGFFEAVTAIVDCFPNVFVASKRFSVYWGTITVVEPEIACMRDLYAKGSWKYFINLTGQEMPLKTNSELVQILTAYRGANDIDVTLNRVIKARWKGKKAPDGLKRMKGSVHIVANREYVDFILHNETAARLLEWARYTVTPDEAYFAILNHNPQLGIPGTYAGHPETTHDGSGRKPFLARYKNWRKFPWDPSCAGHWTRHICILSTGDLPLLGSRREMFANKFHLYNDRVVIGCLEEKLFNDTRDEFLGLKHFDSTYYQTLGFVLNQVGRKPTNTSSSHTILPHTV